jgi:hypothetical protein
LVGSSAEVHAHVDEGLETDPQADALRHQAGEHRSSAIAWRPIS